MVGRPTHIYLQICPSGHAPNSGPRTALHLAFNPRRDHHGGPKSPSELPRNLAPKKPRRPKIAANASRTSIKPARERALVFRHSPLNGRRNHHSQCERNAVTRIPDASAQGGDASTREGQECLPGREHKSGARVLRLPSSLTCEPILICRGRLVARAWRKRCGDAARSLRARIGTRSGAPKTKVCLDTLEATHTTYFKECTETSFSEHAWLSPARRSHCGLFSTAWPLEGQSCKRDIRRRDAHMNLQLALGTAVTHTTWEAWSSIFAPTGPQARRISADTATG